MKRKEAIKKIKNLQDHYKKNAKRNSYQLGIYNGIEIALAILEERIAEYMCRSFSGKADHA